MNCLAHILKYILYAVNLLFLVCGILLIVFGSLLLTSLGDFFTLTEASTTSTLPILIIVLGCFVFLVSFLGCCGAIKNNVCLIKSYCVSMLILFLLQIALLIYAWVAKNSFMDTMGSIVDGAWDNHHDQPAYMDVLQVTFKCCGRQSSSDYLLSNTNIPNSCCGTLNNACSVEDAASKPGCRGEFLQFWSSNFNVIKWAGLGVALIELTALIFGWFIASSIKVSR